MHLPWRTLVQELVINKCSCLFNTSQILAIKVAPFGSGHVETSPEDTSLFFGNKEIVAFDSELRTPYYHTSSWEYQT